MNIREIDSKRAQARISQKAVCAEADVDPTTYSQLKNGHRGAYAATLQKLSDALDRLIAGKAAA